MTTNSSHFLAWGHGQDPNIRGEGKKVCSSAAPSFGGLSLERQEIPVFKFDRDPFLHTAKEIWSSPFPEKEQSAWQQAEIRPGAGTPANTKTMALIIA